MIFNSIYHIRPLIEAIVQLLMIQNNMMKTLLRELPQVIKQLENYTKTSRKKDVESYDESKLATKNVYEYLQMALQSAQPLQRYQCKLSYHLQEDIILILQTSLFKEMNEEVFERIISKNKLFRSFQSIQERYYTHIDKIQSQEIAYICKWIKNYGICGFASFNRNNFIITFLDQQNQDSSITKTDCGNIDNLDYHKQFIKSNSKQSQNSRKQLQTLNKTVSLYAKLTNKTIPQILRLLHQSSGDFMALEAYFETTNPFYLWSLYEDKVLRYANTDEKIKQSFISSIRPLERINQRMKYLGIQ